MPEVKLEIGGRSFPVVCQPGEEDQLHHAASLLNTEADALQAQIGRAPEARMLLLSALMLADKMTEAEARVSHLETQLKSVEEKAAKIAESALQLNEGADPEALAASRRDAAAATQLLADVTDHLEKLAGALEAR